MRFPRLMYLFSHPIRQVKLDLLPVMERVKGMTLVVKKEFGTSYDNKESRNWEIRKKKSLNEDDFQELIPFTFVDEKEVTAQGGAGGIGCYSFVRTRIIKTGHSDGGKGGNGGDVYLIGVRGKKGDLNSVTSDLLVGNDGKSGKAGKQNGNDGKDIQIQVPIGTKIIKISLNVNKEEINKQKCQILTESIKEDERVMIARGGQGGLGTTNPKYKPSLQKGLVGEISTIKLEYTIQSHTAFLGFSKSGKSSLLSSLTRTIARIGDSTINTYHPVIGVLKFIDEKQVQLLDLPPLQREGINSQEIQTNDEWTIKPYRYIRHLKNTKLITVVIASNSPTFKDEVISTLKFIRENQFENKLIYFLLTKSDKLKEEEKLHLKTYMLKLEAPYSLVSVKTQEGINDYVYYLRSKVYNDVRR